MAVGIQIQHRRATAAAWTTSDKVLAIGELGITTDTGAIKIGDGVNVWSDLPLALSGVYLGATAKAADSDLLDGIDATGFYKTADATTAATADKLAMRTSAGKIKAVDGTANEDVATVGQMNTADVVAQRSLIIRSVSDATTSTTLASTDVGKIVAIANSSTTVQRPVIIPTNAADPIAVGSWIDVCSTNLGNLRVGGSGITFLGGQVVFGNFSIIRLIKNATDTWIVAHLSNLRQMQLPTIRVYKSSGTTAFAADVDKCLDFNTIDTAKTFNPDSEWYDTTSFATTKKIIVVKDGLYHVQANWNGTTANQNYIKINKITGTAVVSTLLASAPTFEIGTVSWIGRLTAAEAVGAVFFTGGASDTGKADGTNSRPHDFTVVRLGD